MTMKSKGNVEAEFCVYTLIKAEVNSTNTLKTLYKFENKTILEHNTLYKQKIRKYEIFRINANKSTDTETWE